jgi:hypothetical protein
MARKITQTKTFPFPSQVCFEAVKNSVLGLGWELDKIDREKGEIFASTKMNFKSFGEFIEIRVNPNSNGCTIGITSKLSSQLIGWGKNEDNITDFFARLGLESSKLMYKYESQPTLHK